jgi:excisionase family DNA binding protein
VRTATPWTFLTLDEVADILRIGKRTAYELARTGQLGGATKVGGSWRILKEGFDKWVRQGGGAGMLGRKG